MALSPSGNLTLHLACTMAGSIEMPGQHALHEVVIRRRLLALEAALEALGPGHDLFELGELGDHHVDRFLP